MFFSFHFVMHNYIFFFLGMGHTTYFLWPFNEHDIFTFDDFLSFYTHQAIRFGAFIIS